MPDHEKYMALALQEAQKALSLNEFPVGCVMISNETIVATGRRTSSTNVTVQQRANELDHAEIMALRALSKKHPEIDRSSITLYSTMEPCLMCFSTLILNNIHNIVYGYEDIMGGGTDLPLYRLRPLYSKKTINIVPHVMRQESLDLFKTYFSCPENNYWQESLLAEYTLEQSGH